MVDTPTIKTRMWRARDEVVTAVTLAWWQTSKIWRLLLLTGIGVVAAVAVASAIPLYTWVTLSGGLRQALLEPSDQAQIAYHFSVPFSNQAPIDDVSNQVQQYTDAHLRQYLDSSMQFSMEGTDLAFSAPGKDSSQGDALVNLFGEEMQAAQSHLTLLKGQLPSASGSGYEVAVTQGTARDLNIDIGSVITLGIGNGTPLHVVGILKSNDSQDPFWHHQTLNEETVGGGVHQITYFKALMANGALQSLISSIDSPSTSTSHAGVVLSFYYHLDTLHLDAYQLDALISDLDAATVSAAASIVNPPTITSGVFQAPLDLLKQYRDHISISQVATSMLALLIIALLGFFVSLMTELLIEQQGTVVALWRSRGASRRQIFAALLVQCSGVVLAAAVVGPVLGLAMLALLVRAALSPTAQVSLLLVFERFSSVLALVWLPVLGTAVLLLLVMSMAIWQATRADVLMVRRAAGRAQRKPLWQRLYLDVVAALLAVLGYAALAYILQTDLMTARLRVLVQGPLFLVASVLILVGASLLVLRFFPLLTRLGLRLARRERGVVSLLSLGAMARLPRQALRMILLLTFALAFVVFAQIFNASQSEHIANVASYQAGADISGEMAQPQPFSEQEVTRELQAYRSLNGVSSATIGMVSFGSMDTSSLTDVKVLAIDPDTFVGATLWTTDDPGQVTTLVKQLGQHRSDVQQHVAAAQASGRKSGSGLVLPVLVDRWLADRLHLQVGKHFTLTIASGPTEMEVLRIVGSLPSVNDQLRGGYGTGGIVIDLRSFASYYALESGESTGEGVGPNYVWLRVRDDASSLAQVRSSLSGGPLALSSSATYDRRVLIEQMNADPLYLSFVGVLVLGAIAPILLAVLGNFLAAWWNALSRVNSFVVLRALGATSRGLGNVLLIEQIIVYAIAIVLGLLFGMLLAWLTLGQLIFTTVSAYSGVIGEGTVGSSFTIQDVPPVQIALPASLAWAVVLLLVVCAVALVVMIRTVTRPLLSQALRLNED